MKNFKSIYIVVILLVSMKGCKEFLDEIPPDKNQIATLNKPLLDAFVVGAYEPLSRSRGRLWESTLTRDIEGCAEYTQLTVGSLTNIMNYNFEPIRNDNAPRWTSFYEAIGKANLIIKTIEDDKTLSDADKAPFKGDAYFVRAT